MNITDRGDKTQGKHCVLTQKKTVYHKKRDKN